MKNLLECKGLLKEPRERLKPKKNSYRLSIFKQTVIALKRQRFVILTESNAQLQATLFFQNFWMSHLTYLFTSKIRQPKYYVSVQNL